MSVAQLPPSHNELHHLIGKRDEHFEASLRRDYPVVWWVTLLGPFVVTALVLVAVGLFFGWDRMYRLAGTALGTFFFLGRFVILLGGEKHDDIPKFLTPETLALMVFYLDLMTAMVLAFHTNFVFKLPFIGSRLSEVVDDGRVILQSNPWMKRATFAAIVAFVTFPLAATGSVGGSIFGRLLGMSRLATFAGVVLGSAVGCAMMYFGSELIRPLKKQYGDHPLFTIGGVIFVGAIILVLNHRYRKFKRQRLEAMKLEQESERSGNLA